MLIPSFADFVINNKLLCKTVSSTLLNIVSDYYGFDEKQKIKIMYISEELMMTYYKKSCKTFKIAIPDSNNDFLSGHYLICNNKNGKIIYTDCRIEKTEYEELLIKYCTTE